MKSKNEEKLEKQKKMRIGAGTFKKIKVKGKTGRGNEDSAEFFGSLVEG